MPVGSGAPGGIDRSSSGWPRVGGGRVYVVGMPDWNGAGLVTTVDARNRMVADVQERRGASSLQYRTGPYRRVLPTIGGNDGQPQARSADVCGRRFDGRSVTADGAPR